MLWGFVRSPGLLCRGLDLARCHGAFLRFRGAGVCWLGSTAPSARGRHLIFDGVEGRGVSG